MAGIRSLLARWLGGARAPKIPAATKGVLTLADSKRNATTVADSRVGGTTVADSKRNTTTVTDS